MLQAYLTKGDSPDPRFNRARWWYRCTECKQSIDQTVILKHLTKTKHRFANWYARDLIEQAKTECRERNSHS